MHLEALTLPFQEPVLIFAVVMAIVLVAPLVFERLRVPGLVGLIIAGVVVGPNALGLLERDETIELLGTVGLLYLMFIAGLEIDLNEFFKHRRKSVLFSAFTYGIPQVLGTVAGVTLLGLGWMPAILLGSIIASHTLVAYPIASRLGLAKNEAVTTAVGATIITDSLALLVLAVVAGAAEGDLNAAFLGQLLGLLALYVAFVFVVVPRLGRWFFRATAGDDGVPGFVFVLAVVFAVSFLAEVAGVEAIVGAFLAGLALNRLVPEHGTLMNRLVFVGQALFIPFFLLSVGMIVDLGAFVSDPSAWVTAAVLVGAVMAAKGLAAFAMKALSGYSGDEAWTVFGLTVAQAAATLAAALIGYDLGLFDEAVLNATILMILVTCLVGPWAAERWGRRVALAEAERPYSPTEAPQRVLVPLVEGQDVEGLVELALLLRDPRSEQPVYPLAVVPPSATVEAGVAAQERLLTRAAAHAAASDVPASPATRVDPDAAQGIARAVTEARATTVVMAWDGQSKARADTFGHVIDRLIAQTRAAVLVGVVREPLETVQRVVVAVPPFADRGVGFAHALRTVKTLAGQLGAPLVVVSAQASAPVLEPALAQTKPDVPTAFQAVETWAALVGGLDETVQRGDLLVVVGAREGTLAWRPGMRRLPGVAAARFAETSQLFLYPAEVAFAAPDAPAPEPPVAPAEVRVEVAVGVDGPTWAEALAPAIAPSLADDPVRAEIAVQDLVDFRSGYAPEVRPGIALLHAHAPGVGEPVLHVATAPDGLRLPGVGEGVRVVLALLDPEPADAEGHLARLADAAALVASEETAERLLASATEAEVRAALAAAANAPTAPAATPASDSAEPTLTESVAAEL